MKNWRFLVSVPKNPRVNPGPICRNSGLGSTKGNEAQNALGGGGAGLRPIKTSSRTQFYISQTLNQIFEMYLKFFLLPLFALVQPDPNHNLLLPYMLAEGNNGVDSNTALAMMMAQNAHHGGSGTFSSLAV